MVLDKRHYITGENLGSMGLIGAMLILFGIIMPNVTWSKVLSFRSLW